MNHEDLKAAKILIVDDESVNIKILEGLLTAEGYTHLVSTQDPTRVVDLYRQHEPDLVLLDMKMHIFDGYEVMGQLREAHQDALCPIIVLTALHPRDFLERALEAGASDMVCKPIDRVELLMRVRNMLKFRYLQKANA